MRKPKKRMVRNIAFSDSHSWSYAEKVVVDAVSMAMRYGYRSMTGAVGKKLRQLGAQGKITFLDKTPWHTGDHLLVIGITGGLLVVYHDHDAGVAHSEIVRMCSDYREKIVGKVGAIRWAKVKVTI